MRKLQEKDYLGRKYGRLTITGLIYKQRGKDKRAFFECKCECGNNVTAQAHDIKGGKTQSCGCFNQERRIEHATTHGQKGTRLYTIWKNMTQRCTNPNQKAYKNYGARGIEICPEWKEFKPFMEWSLENGYSNKLTLDRENNNDGYNPNNCRWVTMNTQAQNRRTPITNKSGVKGVYYYSKYSKWAARITVNDNRIHLGYYDTIDQAAKARRQAELKYWNGGE